MVLEARRLYTLCMRTFAAVLAVLLPSTAIGADDRLQPTDAVFARYSADGYYLVLETALLSGHTHRQTQMVTLPSFQREQAVYIYEVRSEESRAAKFEVHFVRVRSALWEQHAELLRKRFEDPAARVRGYLTPREQLDGLEEMNLEVERDTAPIGADTVKELQEVWNLATATVRPARCRARNRGLGLDGSTFVFAHLGEAGWVSGKTWSPEPKSLMSALVALGQRLERFPQLPEEERPTAERSLSSAAKRLLARLEREGPRGCGMVRRTPPPR